MEEDYMTEKKAIENNLKFRILIKYLKDLIGKEAYINTEEIRKILILIEEVE